MNTVSEYLVEQNLFGRDFLRMCAVATLSWFHVSQLGTTRNGSLAKEQRDSMSPSQVINELKTGSERSARTTWQRETIELRNDSVRLANTQQPLPTSLSRRQIVEHIGSNGGQIRRTNRPHPHMWIRFLSHVLTIKRVCQGIDDYFRVSHGPAAHPLPWG